MEALSGFLTNPALALAGLALGSVPVIIHLLNRTFYDRHQWAAMDFLLRAEKKTRRRVLLENFLLMLLRYLLLALLGLALAQPFLNEPALSVLGQQKTHFAVVLDQSYSMSSSRTREGAETVYQQAKKKVTDVLNNQFQPASGDTVSIFTASANPGNLMKNPSQDRSRALQLVNNSSPSFYQGELIESLEHVRQNLEDIAEEKNTRIVWVTDLQENTWIPKNEGRRKRVKDKLERLSNQVEEFVLADVGEEYDNLGITNLTTRDEFLVKDRPIDLTARIRNFSDRKTTATLTLYKDDRRIETIDLNLAGGNSVEKQFNPVRFEDIGPHSVRAELSEDELVVDNKRYHSLQIDEHIDVLIVDGDPGEGSETKKESYFLRTALDPEEGSTPYNVKVVSDYLFRDEELTNYDLVILANLSSIPGGRREDLRSFVNRGGGVLLFFGDQVTIKSYNDKLYEIEKPLLPGELVEIERRAPEEGDYVRMDQIDFDHPALTFFEPYPDKLTSLITHGWVRMKIPEDALNVRVLAQFNDKHNAPAIAERSIGRGKFMTIQTSADMDWNFWPNFQGYVLLVDRLSRYLLRQKEQSLNVRVGGQYNMPVSTFESSKKFRVISPDEQVSVRSVRPVRDGEYIVRLDRIERPGPFRIEKEFTGGPSDWKLDRIISANVASDEGDLSRVSRQKMKSMYPEVSFRSPDGRMSTSGTSTDTDLWKLFAVLVLLFLGLESLLALRIDRKRQL